MTRDIAKDGYDAVEANSNGVVVQEKPVVTGIMKTRGDGDPSDKTFQEAFAEKLNLDPEIAEREAGGLSANFASLSHGHLNFPQPISDEFLSCVARMPGGMKTMNAKQLKQYYSAVAEGRVQGNDTHTKPAVETGSVSTPSNNVGKTSDNGTGNGDGKVPQPHLRFAEGGSGAAGSVATDLKK